MSSQGTPQKRSLEQRRRCCASTTRFVKKRSKAVTVPIVQSIEEKGENSRNWDELEHGILVIIIKCLVQRHGPIHRSRVWPILRQPFLVCKPWMMAVLGFIFPGNVLNLGKFHDISPGSYEWPDLLFFLKGALNHPHLYTKLHIPDEMIIAFHDYRYIAQRLPGLKSVVHKTRMLPFILAEMIQYWPELEEVHCHAALIRLLSKRHKDIWKLELCGRLGDYSAGLLVTHFPRLTHLSVNSCVLSPNALSIILEGRPNLSYLDTRHAFRLKGRFPKSPVMPENVMEWNEDEIREKAAGITTYLHCARKTCSYCEVLYSSHSSPANSAKLIRFSSL